MFSPTRRFAARAASEERPLRLPLDAHWLTVGGLVLMLAAWWLAWFGPAPWSWYYFFPLWLGYTVMVDGLVLRRAGSSPLTRHPAGFAWLFVCSVPLWWGYEAANERLGNWEYLLPDEAGWLRQATLSSLSFSIVLPAVFETAEFYRTVDPFRPARHWFKAGTSRAALIALVGAGLTMIVLALLFPRQAFPLIWIGVFLVLDPLNAFFGGKSIVAQTATGRWDTVLVLFAAGITCGLLWECWNFWSSPKWVYHVPYFDWLRLFEMPILGYGGYFPFALELYAAYHSLCLLLFRRPDDLLRFDEPTSPRIRA